MKMSDYAGMEKNVSLPVSLPENNEPMNTVPGDGDVTVTLSLTDPSEADAAH